MDAFWNNLRSLRLQEFTMADAWDILIVSFVVYRILVVMKGTRASKIASGIGLLVAFYFISRVAHLRVIQWIFITFLPYFVFGIIVLYQAEIRKALAALGSTRLLGWFTSRDRSLKMDDIVLAALTLSSKRTGALIIIERNMGLRNYTENGILLNASMSYDLLVTVFHPETPLHDGAVIVQKGKIAAAACFLPLTLEPHLSKEYGTRHRAAIGITEETDAVAVVVSEETGRISAALGGKLVRMANSDALTIFLRETLGVTPRRRKKRKGWWPGRRTEA